MVLTRPRPRENSKPRSRVRIFKAPRAFAIVCASETGSCRCMASSIACAGGGEIERRERLSRDEFFEQYYFQNRPVIITGAFDFWPARSQWNWAYFRERCGDCEVEVQFGRETDA